MLGARSAEVTASAWSRPAFMNDATVETVVNSNCTWPTTTSVMAGPTTCRHMNDIGFGQVEKQFSRHVISGTGTGRDVVELARPRESERNQFFRSLDRDRRMNHQDHRRRSEWSDGCKVAQRIVRKFCMQARADADLGCRSNQHGVSVRRRLDREIGADRTRGTRTIVHEHLLTESVRELLRDDSRNNVRAAARGEGYDEANRLRRIRLTLRGWIAEECCNRHCDRGG